MNQHHNMFELLVFHQLPHGIANGGVHLAHTAEANSVVGDLVDAGALVERLEVSIPRGVGIGADAIESSMRNLARAGLESVALESRSESVLGATATFAACVFTGCALTACFAAVGWAGAAAGGADFFLSLRSGTANAIRPFCLVAEVGGPEPQGPGR